MISQNIFNQALLGLDQNPTPDDVPPALAPLAAQLNHDDPAARCYELCALALAYERAGQGLASSAGWQSVPAMPPTTKVVQGPLEQQLVSWLEGKQWPFVDFALEQLAARGYQLAGAGLASFLNGYPKTKRERHRAVLVGPGQWLLQQLGEEAADSEDFDAMGFPARKEHLRQLMATDTAAAEALVASLWGTAPVKHREDYLEIIGPQASVEFLEKALKDRGSYVREQAQKLLSRRPGSPWAVQLESWLGQMLAYDQQKGWSFRPLAYDKKAMKPFSLEEISPVKKESDEHYLRRQLIQLCLNQDFWLQLTSSADPAELAVKFSRHKLPSSYFQDYHFNNQVNWLVAVGGSGLVKDYLLARGDLDGNGMEHLSAAQLEELLAARSEQDTFLRALFKYPYEVIFEGQHQQTSNVFSGKGQRVNGLDNLISQHYIFEESNGNWGLRLSLLIIYILKNRSAHYYYYDESTNFAASIASRLALDPVIDDLFQRYRNDGQSLEFIDEIVRGYARKQQFAQLLNKEK